MSQTPTQLGRKGIFFLLYFLGYNKYEILPLGGALGIIITSDELYLAGGGTHPAVIYSARLPSLALRESWTLFSNDKADTCSSDIFLPSQQTRQTRFSWFGRQHL